MKYITQTKSDSSRTRCAKVMNHSTVTKSLLPNQGSTTNQKKKKLQKDTHTKKQVSPPIIITISKRNMIRFQP